jgi:aryl carrier-like protein
MIPTAIIVVEALALTASGKLDRSALPAPQWEVQELADAAPCTPVERSLAAIWREVLHVDRVGRHDNFFDIGGHSLLASRVLHRLRSETGLNITLRELYASASLAELAATLERRQAQADQDLSEGAHEEGEI